VRLFLTRSLAVLVALVLILMTLDLLGESGKILAVPGNGDAELWQYVALRVPLLTARFMPFSVLLGTLIAFTGLNQHSEVIAMKAAGISAHQILAPLIVASVGIAAAAFAFNETVVVKAARTVTAWSDNDYRPIPPDSDLLSNVWVLVGNDLVRARQVVGQHQALRANGLTIYDREGGTLHRVIDAERARPEGNAWQLENVRIYDATMNLVRRHHRITGLPGVEPERLTLAKADRGSARWPVAQDLGTAVDAADATACRGRRLRPRPLGPSAPSRDCRDGARLRLFRRRQFQPGDGQCRRLPAPPRRLGAICLVLPDR
jgi:lipopolysaccharide export system permease protein